MFSYNTPNFIKKIDARALSIFFTVVFALSIIPMLVLGFYDWPSADDFSMALQPHQYYAQTGSVFGAVVASLKKSWWVYSQYEGYFFSIILTCIAPNVFGEGWYFVTPFIILGMLIFGVCYFFDALFVRAWKMDKHLANTSAMVTLILMIHCLSGRGLRFEAFYWYSGAINYTFTFGMAFFWLGLVIRSVYDDSRGHRKGKLIWAAFWGFWMGGANYLTALELAICSVLMLFVFFMIKKNIFKLEGADEGQKRSFGLIWIPFVTNLIGFACSCFTPGNLVRSSETNHYGPVKAILLSLHSTFDMMINDMSRWELYAALVLLIPVFWKMGERMKQRLGHPIMFALFAFLMASSNMTPAFFAVANVGAGRIQVLGWMEYVFLMVMVTFYFTVWARQHLEKRDSAVLSDVSAGNTAPSGSFSESSSLVIVLCLGFILAGSVLCVVPNGYYYSATSAVTDLVSGNARGFKDENIERLQILNDDSVKDAVVSEHEYQPEMLYSWDVTRDKKEWMNTAVAVYYNKDTVVLADE
jgi:hypothetical protein